MTALEAAARQRWLGWSVYRKFTRCHDCGEHRYCGAKRCRGPWLCVGCFDLR